MFGGHDPRGLSSLARASFMSDEIPVVDCHECKDLEFARNLVRSMREGYGRHNSNRSFRNLRWWIQENQQARVIGQIGDKAVRERWQDCEIGDTVSAYHMREIMGPTPDYLKVLLLRKPTGPVNYTPGDEFVRAVECEELTFERVAVELTFERVAVEMCESDSDGARHTDYFWKRIS